MDRLANSGQFSIKRDVLFIDGIPRSRAQAEVLADKVDMLLLLHLRADQEPMLERIHKTRLAGEPPRRRESRCRASSFSGVRSRDGADSRLLSCRQDPYGRCRCRSTGGLAADHRARSCRSCSSPRPCSTPPERLTEPAYAAPCCASTTATAVSCTICSTVEFDGIRCTGRSNPIRMGPTASAPARHCVSL